MGQTEPQFLSDPMSDRKKFSPTLELTNQISEMFTGKIMDRVDTLSSHQSSEKHAACFMKDTSKTKHMTGLMDKAIAKVNQNELDSYEKCFNTAYDVSKNNQPFSDYTFLCNIQIKNSLHLGGGHLGWDDCVTLLKLYLKFYANYVINHMQQVQFNLIIPDGSTDSSH